MAKGIFDRDEGIFATGKPDFIGIQIVGGLVIALWSGILSFIFFYTIKNQNRLRISIIGEIVGVDFLEHGNQGYKMSSSLLRAEARKVKAKENE